MINVGIIGASGYTGEELIDVLLRHPNVRLTNISSRSGKSEQFADLFSKFKGRTDLAWVSTDLKEIIRACAVVFLALPHTASMEIVPKLLAAGIRVIDLSADYRLQDTKIYEEFYKVKQTDKVNLAKAVYGLPEIYRLKIKAAKLIANPGCFPTASVLGLAPLAGLNLIDPSSIIIDAKSGVTGAGRKLTEGLLFSEANEDFKAYKVNTHQHAPEINQELTKLAGKNIKIIFVPHLLPVNRGILATIYVKKAKSEKRKAKNLIELYKKFYKNEPFVRIRAEGEFPRLKDVAGTNFCDIGIQDNSDNIIIISAIDNLLKGASGQAVQNFNIMHGFLETTALL
ncbi:MAG: N-acetyl-gamma-glutamyl-phosphate reductase [Candidatus Omnitrophota bacterium]